MNFRLFKIDFYIPFYVVCLMAVAIIIDTSFAVCSCFISALIHETGHLIAMGVFSLRPQKIKLNAFDIQIIAKNPKSLFSDLVITFFGPLFNLIFALLFYSLSKNLFLANLFIGAFNLLPVDTFDGGHALRLLLNVKFGAVTTDIVLKVLTFVFLVPFLFLGITVLFTSRYNYSLLLISLYLIAILFIK